ncbi:mucin-binding protein, partial [Paucilactobacillus suebicus]
MLGDYRKLSSKNHTSHEDKSGLHYRMYKSGKTWLFSSLFAVAIFGASTLTAQADTNTDQADSSQVATISSSSASSSAVVLNSASATSESASADATSIATNSTADSQSTSSESSNQSSATSNETSSAVVAETSDASSTASSASNTSTASSATVAASDATSINSDSSISAASAGTASSSSATTSSASGSQSVTSLSSAADSVTLSGASSNSADLNTVTLINPSSDAIADAKTSAEQAYALTGQAQEVQAVADDTTTNVTVTLNATAVGYNTGVSSLIVTVSVTNPVAGETYTINFPATTAVIQSYSYQDLSSVGGTSTWTKNSDGTYTLVGTFNSSKTGVVSQVITVSLLTNAWANSNPMQEIGTTTKTITYSVDGVDQTPLTFTQTITPGLNSNFGTTTRTNTATSTGVQPNTDYIYTFKVGEWNGVSDSSNASNIINSAANYGGTTITIPVPAGFVLDSSMTQALNVGADGTNYLAGTTITQPDGPGGNIIITASAASGKQGWNTPSGYQIVGYYTTTQTSANQTLAASGPATFTQVINAAGDTLTGTGTTVWTDTLIGTATATTNTGTVTLNGNSSSASTTLSLGTSTPPATLNSFTLTNTSTSSSTNASLTVSIPNGFNVTTITTPTSVNNSSYYMNGTTSYSYVITLADGTQENGIVDAGSSITSADGSAIRTAVITPNYLAAGAKSGSFTLVGTLSTTYDNGSAVNIGDKLTTTVTLNFGGSSTAAATKSVTQTVAEAYTNVYAYVHQTSQVPGATNSGFMSLQQIGSNPHTTNLVYEPIFYYVIPTSTTIYKVANTGDAKVSYSTTDDGRTLVIIDYTGTGDYVDMTTGSGYVQVALSNNSDALPGQYKYYMYVDSPTTKINNTGAAADLSYVNGDTNAVTIAIGNWTLNSAGIFTDYSYAQGNEDTDAVTSGTADTHGDSTVTFYTSVVNTSASSTNTTATEVVNLPTVGDSQGSQYNFELTGPITVPTNYTTAAGTGTAITATVLYSTSLQSIDANSTSPDTTGYVTADQVTDWSAIRSVIIELTGISSNTSTGRIAFIGTVEDFQSQAGNTGYLETAIYVGTSKPSISSKGTAAQLSIEGQSTVYARLHYTLNGQDVYVDLPDLTQTLNENVDVLQDIYPTTESGFSATDQALFPAGYTLVANSMHIVGADGGVGSAVIGDVAQFSYDGNYVQYELIGDSNLDITYVDDDEGGIQVGDTVTVNGPSGSAGSYTLVIPDGYKLADTQDITINDDTISFTYTAGDTPLTIHLVHDTTVTDMTTTNTVSYTGLPDKDAQASKSTTVNWTVTVDPVLNTTTYVPDSTTTSIVSPTVEGYTPSQSTVTFSQGSGATEPTSQSAVVTYTADSETATVNYVDDVTGEIVKTDSISGFTDDTGTYTVDLSDINSGYRLASGQSSSVDYTLAANNGTTLTINLTHHLTHSTTTSTQTINYVILNGDGTASSDQSKAPASHTQNLTWKVVTDDVTGTSYATAEATGYPAVTSPTVDGYTPSANEVDYSYPAPTATANVKDTTETINYTPDAETATVTYVDDVTGETVKTATINGVTDESGTYTADLSGLNSGYRLAAGQNATEDYTITTDDSDNLTIHLTHHLTNSTTTSTQTINYVILNGDGTVSTDQTKAPASHTQNLTWKVVTDDVTGTSYATAEATGYPAVTSPTVNGYTPSASEVDYSYPAPTATANVKDTTETINYTPDAETATVTYVDDVTGETVKTDTINGVTDESGTYTADLSGLNSGYRLAAGQSATEDYTITTDDSDNLTIHLTHHLTNSTTTSTQTINYVILNGDGSVSADQSKAPASHTQNL